jgi:hypothetical protein
MELPTASPPAPRVTEPQLTTLTIRHVVLGALVLYPFTNGKYSPALRAASAAVAALTPLQQPLVVPQLAPAPAPVAPPYLAQLQVRTTPVHVSQVID